MKGLTVNSKRFIIARESRGMNQIELADKIGVQQGTISKIETGILKCDKDMLKKISKTLKYPESFFYADIDQYPVNLFYRKKPTTTSMSISQIEARMNIYRDNIETLLRSVDFNSNIVYLPDKDPIEVAKFYRNKLGIPRGPIENIVDVLEKNGIIIIPYQFGTDKLDGISMNTRNGQPIIFINKGFSGDRERLTIAHEFAHIVLHLRSEHPFDKSLQEMEKEAFLFASEFLMPQEEIFSQLNVGKLTIAKLADLKRYWKVSMAAILHWAQDINAITSNQSRYLWAQLTSMGYRKEEPIVIPKQQPKLLKSIIDFFVTELHYSKKEVSDLLYLFEDEFEEMYLANDHGGSPILKVLR